MSSSPRRRIRRGRRRRGRGRSEEEEEEEAEEEGRTRRRQHQPGTIVQSLYWNLAAKNQKINERPSYYDVLVKSTKYFARSNTNSLEQTVSC